MYILYLSPAVCWAMYPIAHAAASFTVGSNSWNQATHGRKIHFPARSHKTQMVGQTKGHSHVGAMNFQSFPILFFAQFSVFPKQITSPPPPSQIVEMRSLPNMLLDNNGPNCCNASFAITREPQSVKDLSVRVLGICCVYLFLYTVYIYTPQ